MEEARDVLAECPGGPREDQFVAVGDTIDTSGLDGFLRSALNEQGGSSRGPDAPWRRAHARMHHSALQSSSTPPLPFHLGLRCLPSTSDRRGVGEGSSRYLYQPRPFPAAGGTGRRS